jgi:hypothetical protein
MSTGLAISHAILKRVILLAIALRCISLLARELSLVLH